MVNKLIKKSSKKEEDLHEFDRSVEEKCKTTEKNMRQAINGQIVAKQK